MSALSWILVSGVAMSAIALVGGLTLVLPERLLQALVMPLVALAAGTLFGGAFFHMMPEALRALGNHPPVWLSLAGGFLTFWIMEELLAWHHCHRLPSQSHRPLTYLLLIGDGLHNFIGGLAVGGAFLTDVRLGITTWLVAAAHEIPQELGDFGVLIHGGWSKRRALLFNLLSAGTFVIGGLTAVAVSDRLDVTWLVPFAAGNFLYLAATDLIPEIKHSGNVGKSIRHLVSFLVGLGILYLVSYV